MNNPTIIIPLLFVAILSGCQSNESRSSGVVIGPQNSSTDELETQSATDSEDSDTATDAEESGDTEDPGNTSTGDSETPSNPDTTTSPIDFSNESFNVDSAQTTGNLQNSELTEVSGLAASTRQSNTFWAINDSGNDAKLFAFDHQGSSLGTWAVAADNIDWEDMAGAWINGESYLFIADIGDNLTAKDEHQIYVVAEPVIGDSNVQTVTPLHTIRFRYPDGAHNAESLAIDGDWLYVLTKEDLVNNARQASSVYRIPVSISGQIQTVDAELIAQLAIPASTLEATLIASVAGVDVSQPTAFDIDSESRNAYVLTYRDVYWYQRGTDQSWAEVLAQPRESVHTHSLSQAEALAVSENGVVWFTSEKQPAPLWALPSN